MAVSPTYNDNIFINCPFDEEYKSLFYAIVFTIYHCGFYPKCALEEDDSTEIRLKKILLLIEDCKYGIHDISRTELDIKTKLPRFNMPFELGLFFACKEFGKGVHKSKKALVLDSKPFRYQKFISDLSGVDPKAHNCVQKNVIQICRDWINVNSNRKTIPGTVVIKKNYRSFRRQLPKIVERAGLEMGDLKFNDLCYLIEEWLLLTLSKK